jgi:hypothetical protein
MDEEAFDSWMHSRHSRPFGREDAKRAEAQLLRCTKLLATLGVALWGRTSGDLQRQLLAASPEVPSGFDLPDFRELLYVTTQMISGLEHAKNISIISFGPFPATYLSWELKASPSGKPVAK